MQHRKFIPKPYAASFAVRKPCGTQSKALDNSIRRPTTKKLLSKFPLHSFSNLNKILIKDVVYCSVFYSGNMWKKEIPFLKRAIIIIFSYIFEKKFNKLTGLNFETQNFLFFVFVFLFLSAGITVATSAPEGKCLMLKYY